MAVQSSQIPPLEIPRGAYPGVADALRHWHEHRPKMYAELYHQGLLFKRANEAFTATLDDCEVIEADLIENQQYDPATACVLADQMVRERYIYLPTEEDVPELMQTETGLYVYESAQGD